MITRRTTCGLVPGLLQALLCACVFVNSGEAGAENPAENQLDAWNEYQRIKDADEHGLSIGRFATGANEATADIVLDEQGEARGGRGNDAAPRRLFRRVAQQKLRQGTYPEFIALLANYVVRSQQP